MAHVDMPATTLLDHFAAQLARHGDVTKAAAQVGRGSGWGRARLAEICEELGIPVDPVDEAQDLADRLAQE